MALPYALREGIAGFRRATFASLASVSALAVALVLIGMTLLVGWIVQTAAEDLRESAGEIEVYLEDADTAETDRLRARLEIESAALADRLDDALAEIPSDRSDDA